MFKGGADVIIIEIKRTISAVCLNHPQTISLPPVHRKTVFHETGPWCQNGWGLLYLDYFYWILEGSIIISQKREHIWVISNVVEEPKAYYTEWSKSEREKQILYINTYIWNVERWSWWSYLQRSNWNADIRNRFVDTVGEGECGRTWESSTEMHHRMWNRQPVGICLWDRELKSGAPWQPRGMDGVGCGRQVREGTHLYLWLIHAAVWQNQT